MKKNNNKANQTKQQKESWFNSPLDDEEQWYEDHSNEFVVPENQEELRNQLIQAAKQPPIVHHTENRENKKSITLRLEQEDISDLKSLAVEQGLSYQTLIGSVLHRYVKGTLVDVNEAKKVLALK